MIAIIAAAQFVTFGALFLWVPTRPHFLQFLAFAGYALATVRFGWDRTHGAGPTGDLRVNVIAVVCPLLLAGVLVLIPHDLAAPGTRRRLARPVLTSASIVAACAALATVALLDNESGVGTLQSTLMIVLLGSGMAARVLANQVASTQANRDAREALAHREAALQEADMALERVRETNETLRRSEEHLRLVFDAAVDGFVELDERDVIVRANEAFARMVGIDS